MKGSAFFLSAAFLPLNNSRTRIKFAIEGHRLPAAGGYPPLLTVVLSATSGTPVFLALLRHIPFIRAVISYSFTAFGGPQGHIGMMMKTFVHKRRDVTEEELLEYNAFCQMLPGPGSTQTVMLIAYKRGGALLAIVTLGLWILPAFLLMTAASFLLVYFREAIPVHLFDFIRPMSVGFVFYAAWRMMRVSVRHPATWAIMLGTLFATILIKSPWVFPAVLLAAGFASNFSSRRIPTKVVAPKKINWGSLWLFALLFVGAGVLSELARVHEWPFRRAYNLFENFYRFGAIVFGGGQALLPMLLYQFVTRPQQLGEAPMMSAGELLTGYGLVQAAPGPVFSFCAFTGGMVLHQYGPAWQLAGSFIATIAVFLPGTLLLLFLFPIYNNLKQHVIIYRALEGLHAAVVGIVWASGFLLLQSLYANYDVSLLPALRDVGVILIVLYFLLFTKLPAPYLVVLCLIAGLVQSYV